MPGHIRRFSELSEDQESGSSSIGVFTNCRSSVSATGRQELLRDAKRHKTSGLNSRFDRMIETMSAVYHSPANVRRRTRSIGSSSVSSHDVPRTPVDAYNGLQEGRLGSNFSVIKMNTSIAPRKQTNSILGNNIESSASEAPPPRRGLGPLPQWLWNTFSSLPTMNPLRLLLAHSPGPAPQPVSPGVNPLVPVVDAQVYAEPECDVVFAFSPDNVQAKMRGVSDVIEEVHPGQSEISIGYHSSSPRPPAFDISFTAEGSIPDFSSDSGSQILPFSTPGPGSLASRSALPPSDELEGHSERSLEQPFSKPGALYLPPNLAVFPNSVTQYSRKGAPEPAFHEENATDDSSSDLLPHDAHLLPNLFSTPGSIYRAPHPIYFDSPTEDPSHSDSLLPGFELDYDALDFRWEPFNRKGTNGDEQTLSLTTRIAKALETDSQQNSFTTQDLQYPNYEDYVRGTTEKPPPLTLKNTLPLPLTSSPGRCSSDVFRFAPPGDHRMLAGGGLVNYDDEAQEQEPLPKTPEMLNRPQFFAPALGIYISPLRDREQAQTEDEQAQEIDDRSDHGAGLLENLNAMNDHQPPKATADPGDVSYSQGSNDSIESWKDAFV